MANLRNRNSALLVEKEAVEGTAETLDPAADGVLAEVSGSPVTWNQDLIQTNEVQGSIDRSAPIVGGLKPQLQISCFVKGAPAAGSAPEYSDLLEASGFSVALRASPIPSSSTTAAASGSATTVVIDRTAGNGSQWPSSSGSLIGEVVELAGNPATAVRTQIVDYQVSGNNATVTLADSFSPALDNTTTIKLLPNALYRPVSTFPTITAGWYTDGLLYRLKGGRCNPTITLQAGQPGRIAFQATGQFSAHSDTAVPSVTYASQAVAKPIFKNPDDVGARMRVNRLLCKVRGVTLNVGNALIYPDNPEATEGYDPSEVSERAMTGSIDPLKTLLATRSIFTDFKDGVQRMIHIRYGITAGNRHAFLIPAAQFTRDDPGDRDGLHTEQVDFAMVGANTGLYYCIF